VATHKYRALAAPTPETILCRLLAQLQASEHDKLAAHLYRSRWEYRLVCQRAGKSGKQIERCVIDVSARREPWLQRRPSPMGALSADWRLKGADLPKLTGPFITNTFYAPLTSNHCNRETNRRRRTRTPQPIASKETHTDAAYQTRTTGLKRRMIFCTALHF
jgi:hypothetical protein